MIIFLASSRSGKISAQIVKSSPVGGSFQNYMLFLISDRIRAKIHPDYQSVLHPRRPDGQRSAGGRLPGASG
jgi:hypothetical protein